MERACLQQKGCQARSADVYLHRQLLRWLCITVLFLVKKLLLKDVILNIYFIVSKTALTLYGCESFTAIFL